MALDGIIISTPTPTHESLITEAAHNGLSIFSEKPIDETVCIYFCETCIAINNTERSLLHILHIMMCMTIHTNHKGYKDTQLVQHHIEIQCKIMLRIPTTIRPILPLTLPSS